MSEKINVVCCGMMCFPVDADSLEPLRTTCYDPWAISHPEPQYKETIGEAELYRRRAALGAGNDYCRT